MPPTTTTSSVIGIKYKDGVVIAADMLGSYGSMHKFYDIERVQKVNLILLRKLFLSI